MATLKLYSVSDDFRVLEKNLGSSIYECSFLQKENTSFHDPVFRIKKPSGVSLTHCNYAYVPESKRYYYVTDFVKCQGGIVELICTVDAGKSFASDIKKIKTVIERQENVHSAYFKDDYLPTTTLRNVTQKNIGSFGDASGSNFVITITGGV